MCHGLDIYTNLAASVHIYPTSFCIKDHHESKSMQHAAVQQHKPHSYSPLSRLYCCEDRSLHTNLQLHHAEPAMTEHKSGSPMNTHTQFAPKHSVRPCSKLFTHCEPCREVFMFLREQACRTQNGGSLNWGKMGRCAIVFGVALFGSALAQRC